MYKYQFWGGQTLFFLPLNPVFAGSCLSLGDTDVTSPGAGQRRSGWPFVPLVLTLGCPKPARTSRDVEPSVPPWTPHPVLGTPFLGLALWGWILQFWGWILQFWGREAAPS